MLTFLQTPGRFPGMEQVVRWESIGAPFRIVGENQGMVWLGILPVAATPCGFENQLFTQCRRYRRSLTVCVACFDLKDDPEAIKPSIVAGNPRIGAAGFQPGRRLRDRAGAWDALRWRCEQLSAAGDVTGGL